MPTMTPCQRQDDFTAPRAFRPGFPFRRGSSCMCPTAFWGQCQLGELLPPSSRAPLLALIPVRSSFRKSPRNPQSFILQLPHTKTHSHGQDVVLVSQRLPYDPISLLRRHFQFNDMPEDALMSSHMFCTRSHLFSHFSAFGLNLSHVTTTNTASLVLCRLVYSHYTSSHADVTHHTRGHTLRHTSSYTVYLAQPYSLQSFNYRSGSSVDICTRTHQATHQQSRGGHASHARSHPATYIIIQSLSNTTPLFTII